MLDPLIPYIAAALGLVATLVLFVSVKRDVHRTTRRERKRFDEMVEQLRNEPHPAPAAPAHEPAQTVYVPVQLRPGFNISRRVHAMRLLRKGENISHVAAALGVARREVELLVRVQKIVSETVDQIAQATVSVETSSATQAAPPASRAEVPGRAALIGMAAAAGATARTRISAAAVSTGPASTGIASLSGDVDVSPSSGDVGGSPENTSAEATAIAPAMFRRATTEEVIHTRAAASGR